MRQADATGPLEGCSKVVVVTTREAGAPEEAPACRAKYEAGRYGNPSTRSHASFMAPVVWTAELPPNTTASSPWNMLSCIASAA